MKGKNFMITLYTIHCPACNVLAKKLDAKNLTYTIIDDIDTLNNLGITQFPVLEVDNVRYNFSDAVKLINNI